jgi:asparagine synthetase B (glutamine-hydrolysing)
VPFGDCSTIPTNILVHESLSWTGDASVVLEGTGADGAFGVGASYPQWRGVYAAPAMLRRSLGAAYDWLGLWRRASSLERVGRAVRKSASLPLAQAAVVYHALDGIAYATPPDVQRELLGVIETGIDVMSAGATPEERFSLLDLVLVCAGRMAPKSFDPLRRRGIRPLYPFLDPSMLALSASLPWALKCAGGSEKGLLKTLLARDVPSAWVYRAKSGFTPPYRELFASVPLQAFLHDVVLSRDNPLLGFCRPVVLRQLVDAAAHRRLGSGGYDFLWTLAFASGWLAQLPRRTARRGVELACAAS